MATRVFVFLVSFRHVETRLLDSLGPLGAGERLDLDQQKVLARRF